MEFVSTIAFCQCIEWPPNELMKCERVWQKVASGRSVLKKMLGGWHQDEVGDVRWTLTNDGMWEIGPTNRWEMGG